MPTYLAPGVYIEEIDSEMPAGAPSPRELAWRTLATPISRPSWMTAERVPATAFIGFTDKSPPESRGRPVHVENWDNFQYVFGGFVEGALLPFAVRGYFENGGRSAYVVSYAESDDSPPQVALTDETGAPVMTVSSTEDWAHPTVVVEPASSGEDASGGFDLRIRVDDVEWEAFEGLTLASAERAINGASRVVKVTTHAATPAAEIRYGRFPTEVPRKAFSATLSEILGSGAEPTGIGGLGVIDDIAFVTFPDLMTGVAAEFWDAGAVKAAQTALTVHCEQQGDRFAILDGVPAMSPADLAKWRREVATYDSRFATLYHPWLEVEDPRNSSAWRTVPPCGHVAGVLSRELLNEGFEAVAWSGLISGAAPHDRLHAEDRDRLVAVGVNPLIAAPGRGVRAWLETTLSSDMRHRDLRARMLLSRVETSIMNNTAWALFHERSDAGLWADLTREITGFLHHLWRRGILSNSDDEPPYHVRCDEVTNPPESTDLGKTIAEVTLSLSPGIHHFFRVVYFS